MSLNKLCNKFTDLPYIYHTNICIFLKRNGIVNSIIGFQNIYIQFQCKQIKIFPTLTHKKQFYLLIIRNLFYRGFYSVAAELSPFFLKPDKMFLSALWYCNTSLLANISTLLLRTELFKKPSNIQSWTHIPFSKLKYFPLHILFLKKRI